MVLVLSPPRPPIDPDDVNALTIIDLITVQVNFSFELQAIITTYDFLAGDFEQFMK